MPEPTETPPTEPTGQEPVIPEPTESPTLPTEPPAEPPAEPVAEPPAESSEDVLLHKLQSWAGRREKELKEEILGTIQPYLTQNAPAEVPPAEAPDPSQDADAWFEHKLQERVSAENQYNDTLIRTGTAIVQQDELVKADQTLANEIYEEVRSGRVAINRRLPAEEAAAAVVAIAKANVLSRRFLKKPNPLEKNQPNTAPVGSVAPPAAPATPTVKVPKMSPLASKAAKRWGFSDEEIAEALKNEAST